MEVLSGVLILLTLGLLVAGQQPGNFSLVYVALLTGAGAAITVAVAVRQHRNDPP